MWVVEFEDAAAKAFRKLDGKSQRAVKNKPSELQAVADPGALAKPLKYSLKGIWRVRLGGLRLLFRLDRGALILVVVDIDRRDSVYD